MEKLENKLTNKENEITMVMELYKEVTTLKEQVKTLKEKASAGSIAGSTKTQPRREREQNTVLHLTKLLRQIQHYQGLYKWGVFIKKCFVNYSNKKCLSIRFSLIFPNEFSFCKSFSRSFLLLYEKP